jgi:serine/threonine-protein kinase TNNI3K
MRALLGSALLSLWLGLSLSLGEAADTGSDGSSSDGGSSAAGSTRTTVVVLYPDVNCASTPAKISFEVNATCSTADADAVTCSAEVPTNPSARTYYYYSKTCTDDYEAFARDAFGDDAYLLLNFYNASGCGDWYAAILYPLDGKCHATDVYGTSGAIASRADNGTVGIQWFDGSTGRGTANNPLDVAGDDVSDEACVLEQYRLVAYNTDGSDASDASDTSDESAFDESTSGSDDQFDQNDSLATSSSSAESATTSSSVHRSGLGTGGVIAIAVAGTLVVVAALFAAVLYRRRRQAHDRDDDLENDKEGRPGSVVVLQEASHKLHRTPTGGSSKSKSKSSKFHSLDSTSASRTVSTRRHHSLQGDMWDDETIIAARVPREKVVIGELISRGGYGEVYLGTYNARQVAVKMLLPERRKQIRHVNDFLAEIKLTATLEHTCIVQFIGVAWDSLMDLVALSEYMEGGDLRGLLESFEQRGKPMGFDYNKVKIAKQVAHALTYLHSLQPMVLHRDLKSRNVLLNHVLDAKLTDFGVSRERVDATMTAGVGTSLWMAPEVMMGQKYDDKADMFSFGVMLAELDSHLLPYSHTRDPTRTNRKLPDTAILQLVVAGQLRVEFSEACLPSVMELGLACVAMDPRDRPTAAEALGRLHTISVQDVHESNDSTFMFSI